MVDSDSGLVNEDPEGEGWLVKGQVSDAAEVAKLMSESEYKAFISSGKEE